MATTTDSDLTAERISVSDWTLISYVNLTFWGNLARLACARSAIARLCNVTVGNNFQTAFLLGSIRIPITDSMYGGPQVVTAVVAWQLVEAKAGPLPRLAVLPLFFLGTGELLSGATGL